MPDGHTGLLWFDNSDVPIAIAPNPTSSLLQAAALRAAPAAPFSNKGSHAIKLVGGFCLMCDVIFTQGSTDRQEIQGQ